MPDPTKLEEGVSVYEEAVKFDKWARTIEDWASVEETYWRAYNLLDESEEPGHKRICAAILERIADRLDAEGRRPEARGLRARALAVRKSI